MSRRCGYGHAASTRPVPGVSCLGHGGSKPPCTGRRAPSSSGDKGGRTAGVSAPSWRSSACLRRAMPGCRGHTRPARASGMPMLAARLARVQRQRAGCRRGSLPGGRRAIWHGIRPRHPWCMAKMPTDGARSPRSASSAWAIRVAHDGQRSAGGSPVSTARQRSGPGLPKRCGRPSGAGGGPCVVTRLATIAPACVIPSCAEGCRRMGRTTRRRCSRPSWSSSASWSQGPCGNTRSCKALNAERPMGAGGLPDGSRASLCMGTWGYGLRLDDRSRMSREVHGRIGEGVGV